MKLKILFISIIVLILCSVGIAQPQLTLWKLEVGHDHNEHSHMSSYPCDSTYYIYYHTHRDTIRFALKNEGDQVLVIDSINTSAIIGAEFEVDMSEAISLLPDEMASISIAYKLPPFYEDGINGGIRIFSNDPDRKSCQLDFDVGGAILSSNHWQASQDLSNGIEFMTPDAYSVLQLGFERVFQFGFTTIREIDPFITLGESGNIYFDKDVFMYGELAVSSFGAVSDLKFKKEIKPITNALDRVLELKPKEYFMKNEEFPKFNFSVHRQYGFVAQDVQQAFPELVNERKSQDQEFLTVDYVKVIPILTKAIQEQQALIETLQSRIAQLESK